MAASYKLNVLLTHDPEIALLGICSNELKTYGWLHKDLLHMDVYSSFIHNCQNVEATKLSFSGRMDKMWYIQTMKYYSALKRNELSRFENTWKYLKCIWLTEKLSAWKGYMLYEFNYMTFWKSRTETVLSEKARWLPGVRWRDHLRFLGNETIPYDIMIEGSMSLLICPNPRSAQHREWP